MSYYLKIINVFRRDNGLFKCSNLGAANTILSELQYEDQNEFRALLKIKNSTFQYISRKYSPLIQRGQLLREVGDQKSYPICHLSQTTTPIMQYVKRGSFKINMQNSLLDQLLFLDKSQYFHIYLLKKHM